MHLCGKFEDGAVQNSSSRIVKALAPILTSFPGGSNFQEAANALNAYQTIKEQAQAEIHFSTCIPWVDLTGKGSSEAPHIAVMTTATTNNKDLFGNDYDEDALRVYNDAYNASVREKTAYCAQHGYDFHVITDTVDGRHTGWYRFPAVLSLFAKYDWVFHVDLDTVILDHSIRLEEFLDPTHDFIIGVDSNGINNGVFFMRNSTWNRMLLAEAWTLTNEPTSSYWYEQAALMRLIKLDGVRNHMKLVPQQQFNSYVSGTALPSREDGDMKTFLVHFAGRGDKWELVLKYNQAT